MKVCKNSRSEDGKLGFFLIPNSNPTGCRSICRESVVVDAGLSVTAILTRWMVPLCIITSLGGGLVGQSSWREIADIIVRWIGSPQRVLTGMIFSLHQMHHCHQQATRWGRCRSWDDTYYVLSVVNQFRFPAAVADAGRREINNRFMKALIFGLFRPLSDRENDKCSDGRDVQYTRQLLSVVASRLRMLRRRSLIPVLLGLILWFISFLLSIALAFGENESSTTPLTIWLIYSSIPILLIYTTIDSTPVSSTLTTYVFVAILPT
jgi:hypothetical protein